MDIPRILYVCTYFGGRSLIAKGFTQKFAAGWVDAYSSSFESGVISSLIMTILKEEEIDLSPNPPKSVFTRFKDHETFDYVVTLCHADTMEQCPVFKTSVDTLYQVEAKRSSWSIPDFSSLDGTEEENLVAARKIRDLIKDEVLKFLDSIGVKPRTNN